MNDEGPVVVGTDFSPSAEGVLSQAAAWATRSGARLIVVHVAADRVASRLKAPEVEAQLRARLQTAAPAFDLVVLPGSPHAELIALADQQRAQLLVVGASATGTVERALFGSTADQVVRYAHCPVLVARPAPAEGPVLAATDFSEAAGPALEAAARECQRRRARLILLHSVYEPASPLAFLGPLVISAPVPTEEELEVVDAAAKETLGTLLEGTGVEGATIISHEAPAVAVVKAAEAEHASLIIVGTRGRTGLARIALGSVAESIVQKAPCSVLAVRVP